MTKKPLPAEPAPAHSDVEIVRRETPFERFLRIDTFAFRHRLHSGEWSLLRTFDVLGAVRRWGLFCSIPIAAPSKIVYAKKTGDRSR